MPGKRLDHNYYKLKDGYVDVMDYACQMAEHKRLLMVLLEAIDRSGCNNSECPHSFHILKFSARETCSC
jgi:hypothetical protein